MAWYNGEFRCGHEGRVNITGPTKDRQWKADNKFSGLCEECWLKQREEEREEERLKANAKAKEMELPSLTGSEKQISWAITLRDQMIKTFTSSTENVRYMELFINDTHSLEDMTTQEVLIIRDYISQNEVSSKFYIGNRFKKVEELLVQFKDVALVDERERELEQNTIKEIEEEALIIPKNKNYESIVDINEVNDEVVVTFEKNNHFIEIVKSLGYKWENGAWRKQIKETTGTSKDRMAELGNKLLNEGFPVRIYDAEAREKAISGDFEQEQDRWIFSRIDKPLFVIRWNGKNDSLYNAARSIPTSKWDNAVTISFGRYKEVEDFAEIYGFKFTKKTIEALEQYKKTISKNETDVAKYKETKKNGSLSDILESKVEILEDLKDE